MPGEKLTSTPVFQREHSSFCEDSASVLVACLCAEWCGVCRDYRARFEQVQSSLPDAKFLWIDVEDQSDLLHPLDVDDFPTILIAVGNETRFFGTVTSQIKTLERLVLTHSGMRLPVSGNNAQINQVVAKIRRDLMSQASQ